MSNLNFDYDKYWEIEKLCRRKIQIKKELQEIDEKIKVLSS